MRFLLASLSLVTAAFAVPKPLVSSGHGVSIGIGTIPISLIGGGAGGGAARQARIHPVVVGGPQDTFVPNQVHAEVGDTIQFQFSSGNHTVTQSAAELACQPLQATVPGAIHSGHIPFEDGQQTVGVFNMPVLSTGTMYLYCATGPHCLEGQVMVVNPASEQQLVDYAKLALGAAANIDGTVVAGGTVDEIPLEEAAFIVPEAEEEEAPPAEEPPAEEEPAEETTAVEEEAPAEETGAEEETGVEEEVPAEETAVEEEAPAEETAVEEEVPAEEPAEEVPTEETPVVEVPAEEEAAPAA